MNTSLLRRRRNREVAQRPVRGRWVMHDQVPVGVVGSGRILDPHDGQQGTADEAVCLMRMKHTLYFGPWRWEQASEGRLYELLGIRLWKWFLRKSGKPQRRWKVPDTSASRREALIAHLQTMAAFTREYEVRHIAGGAAMQFSGMLFIVLYDQGSLLLLTALNVVLNGFPILLQRYNRVRVWAAMQRLDANDHDGIS